jgi:hypothetical protein
MENRGPWRGMRFLVERQTSFCGFRATEGATRRCGRFGEYYNLEPHRVA